MGKNKTSRIRYYLEAYAIEILFFLIILVLINIFHPFGYSIPTKGLSKNIFKAIIEKNTPFILSEKIDEKEHINKQPNYYIGSSYAYEYGMQAKIFSPNITLNIKEPFLLRVGVANLENKTLDNSELRLILPDGVTIADKDGWIEFVPNKNYSISMGSINPGILMNIHPMAIKIKESGKLYKVQYTITGRDVQPVVGYFNVKREERDKKE